MVRQDLSKSERPRSDPLYWHCWKCHAQPDERCRDSDPKLLSTDNIGTHRSRRRLALWFYYNPDAPYDHIAAHFAKTGRRR